MFTRRWVMVMPSGLKLKALEKRSSDLFKAWRVATSALIREVDDQFTFDDDDAFTYIYEQTSPTPDVMVNVPAYDPSQYPGGGQVRTPRGVDRMETPRPL